MPHDDFEIEPVNGLPETPPEGERILWQGAPNAWALARDALNLYWVMGYFVVLCLWRAVVVAPELGWGGALASGSSFLILGAIACAILLVIAIVQARATVYTITNKRVAMRIGAALNVTLNLPYRWIGSADLSQKRDGTGTIALSTMGQTRLSYLVCWPHVRPWRFAPTQPALRSIPNAQMVAELLADAAQTQLIQQTQPQGDNALVAAE
ncbi:photosynthetic complex putative assembly protein PuhB [Pontivivens insulae]|uniref:YdbS-like PH domain-containing protein n=1 Tax=Pontivivens insulae TaxID=1639689 RepID=A0A2R8A9V5_9RHOB|nr:photosynthetic complex putative assembly protein PuhB [Pontivivens insulae]RED12933.1 PH (Pleckstrin Homology) domain-containing protein [Pontivivens insulae]SPF29026.1 hypothetical protein POI8812_01331 [Pontivivens insulae]